MEPLSTLLIAARGAMSTSEVAALAGVSVRSIQAWESGKIPKWESLYVLADVLKVSDVRRRKITLAWEKQKAAANAKRRGVMS